MFMTVHKYDTSPALTRDFCVYNARKILKIGHNVPEKIYDR